MSLYYDHLLIAADSFFAPSAAQVAVFFSTLQKLGTLPLQPTMRLGKPTGELRTGKNPLTGETISIARRSYEPMQSFDEITTMLDGASDYNLIVEGQGPPPTPVFDLHIFEDGTPGILFNGTYHFEVRCCLRNAAETIAGVSGVIPFSHALPSRSKDARFWIEFGTGKQLAPAIKDTLDILEPSVVHAATSSFRTEFFQTYRWE